MNEDLDIFSLGDPTQQGKFFYFKEIGDKIEGTYVDVREGIDNFDNEQYIYVIKDKEGELWNVGVRKSNKILNEDMQNKALGDIIGIRFDEEKESKKFKGNMAKIIRVYPYRQKGPVDEEWLEEKRKKDEFIGNTENSPTSETKPVSAKPEGEVTPVTDGVASKDVEESEDEALNAVRNLATQKGLVTEDMDPKAMDKAISEYTKLELTEENFSQIIIKLTSYKK